MCSINKASSFILQSNLSKLVTQFQSVRFNRKPRWLPIAKSKEFYVREPTPIDPEEAEILRQKYMHYRSSMKSIRHYLKTQVNGEKLNEIQQHELDESVDFAWMEGQVAEWNKSIAFSREERQEQQQKKENERLSIVMERHRLSRLQDSISAKQSLEANKVESRSFINEENLDIEIEKMLDSRSDYNFVLTRDGQKMPDSRDKLDYESHS